MARAKNPGYQVHDSGDHTSLDGIFRLISLGEREEPLEDVLTAMCGDIATIASADVASVYVREEGPDGERFTMRGNVGFPPEALGRVHLGRGEGITGFAADRLRPVSVADADRDARFKYIPGLGEEQFPALLAVPVLRAGAAAGVLVLQRRASTAFTAEEVVLATALAAVLNHALERGEGRERQRAADADRRTVRLTGVTIVGGAAMGRAEALPTLAALTRSGTPAKPTAPAASNLESIWNRLRGGLAGVVTGAAAREIASLAVILEDERFRGRLAEACATATPLKALSELARAYARVPFSAPAGDDGDRGVAGRARRRDRRSLRAGPRGRHDQRERASAHPCGRHPGERAAGALLDRVRDRRRRFGVRRRRRCPGGQRPCGPGARGWPSALGVGPWPLRLVAPRRSSGGRRRRGRRADQPTRHDRGALPE